MCAQLMHMLWLLGYLQIMWTQHCHFQMALHSKIQLTFLLGSQDTGCCVKMTAKIAPGTWMLLKNKDVPQQIGSVDCRVFMLMHDLPNIRRWWALILLENFGVFSERTENLQKTTSYDQGELPGEQATPSSCEELCIIRQSKLAVKWIHANRHVFRGPMEEPLFLHMEEEDKEMAFQNLLTQVEGYRGAFKFCFTFREDMESFLSECHDKMGLRVNCSFKEY
ncbi:uncharacterized protein LOC127447144 isoform X2 [Myxocyprinus asiaticus]|uniref:uncharacterized protein LOC127447144 isoform X2 n=1 Tax=Myxocyprinus asiaticus TaxID=70543 RepID=UPI0022221BFB|nr:uncharacterized protein LOC127447144 isoform X2 [Myxocyprinus asiaticus]